MKKKTEIDNTFDKSVVNDGIGIFEKDSIYIKYKEWYEVDLDNTHGFRKKLPDRWTQEDFTVFIRFKTDWNQIVKTEDENNASCVFGRPGMHLGLMVTDDGYYKFDFWTQEEGKDAKWNDCLIPVKVNQDDNFIDVAISHNVDEKEINLILFQAHTEELLYSKRIYGGDLIDYSWGPTYVGCAFHHHDAGYPHNQFWSGNISLLKVINKFMSKDDIEDIYCSKYTTIENLSTENEVFKFDGKRQTNSVIYDISGNNNHLKWKKSHIMSHYNDNQGSNTETPII
jgi:hypothetical protein